MVIKQGYDRVIENMPMDLVIGMDDIVDWMEHPATPHIWGQDLVTEQFDCMYRWRIDRENSMPLGHSPVFEFEQGPVRRISTLYTFGRDSNAWTDQTAYGLPGDMFEDSNWR